MGGLESARRGANVAQAAALIDSVRRPGHHTLPAVLKGILVILSWSVGCGAFGRELADYDRLVRIQTVSRRRLIERVVPDGFHPIVIMRRVEIETGPWNRLGLEPEAPHR